MILIESKKHFPRGAMKREIKSIWKRLPACTLYLNDLERLQEVVEDVTETVSIVVDGYELEAEDTLRNINLGRVHRVDIRGARPYVSLSFYQDSAYFSGFEDTSPVRGALSLIEETIRPRRKLFWWVEGPAGYMLLPSLLGILATVVFMGAGAVTVSSKAPVYLKQHPIIGFGLVAAIIVEVVVAYLIYRGHRKYSTIMLREANTVGFFIRNRDALIIGTITVAITILASIVVAVFLK